MEVRLVDNPRDPLPYQIHATAPWIDRDLKPTSYLAGFPTQEARARYLEIAGLALHKP